MNTKEILMNCGLLLSVCILITASYFIRTIVVDIVCAIALFFAIVFNLFMAQKYYKG